MVLPRTTMVPTHALNVARRLERIALTEVRYKLHLTYLHQCKDLKKLPPFLHSRPPIDHPKAWEIAEKTGWAYLRVLIGNCHNNLRNIVTESVKLNEHIEHILGEQAIGMLREAIARRCLHEKDKVINRHNKKLTKNIESGRDEKQLKKRWVINTSKRTLNHNEINLLRRGMNFALTPKSIPTKEIIASVEQGINNLSTIEKNDIRERVSSVVKNAKRPTKRNLSRQEEKALKDLRSDKEIIITRADKENAVVVLNRTEYHCQLTEMLEDKNTYKRITDKRRNPTSKTETDLQQILLKLKASGSLSENEYFKLRPFDSYPAAFYCLPKIHKVPMIEQDDHFTIAADTKIPFRPISSSIGSPTYEVSKYLAHILKFLYNDKYTVQNSKEFSNFIANQKVDPDEYIVSFDVTSLFTSIPVDLALQIVKEELAITTLWTLHTNLTAEQICNLLKFTLSNNFFVFDDCHYHQIFGCPMGSPVSAVVAELVMQRIEKVALDSSPAPVRWWKRYVDDSNACLKQLDVPLFHQHLNSVNSHIQFTIEMPAVNRNGSQTIAFLDTQLLGNISGDIDVKVFRKNTHTDKYLPFESHSHKNDKKAVIKTLLDRAKTIPSTSTLQTEETHNVLRALELQKKFLTLKFETHNVLRALELQKSLQKKFY